MPYRLSYTATLQQTDSRGVPNGNTYSFNGSQFFPGASPQAADLANLSTAMGVDISTQMQAGYPVQVADASEQG